MANGKDPNQAKDEASCGCWTDAEGYWHLSQTCAQAELEEWRRIANPAFIELITDRIESGNYNYDWRYRWAKYLQQEGFTK